MDIAIIRDAELLPPVTEGDHTHIAESCSAQARHARLRKR
jgi:hypothetical protein